MQDDEYYQITSQLDAREILRYLNDLGIQNISGQVLKYFISGTNLNVLCFFGIQFSLTIPTILPCNYYFIVIFLLFVVFLMSYFRFLEKCFREFI